MKKYYYKDKEIKVGDSFTITEKKDTKEASYEINVIVEDVTEDYLRRLVETGYVTLKDTEGEENAYRYLYNKVMLNISNKLCVNRTGVEIMLESLYREYPWAVIHILLKELAIELDKKYKDNIKKAPVLFAVSPQDGRIHEVNKNYFKTYECVPLFRSIDDAKIACRIIKKELKKVFCGCKE